MLPDRGNSTAAAALVLAALAAPLLAAPSADAKKKPKRPASVLVTGQARYEAPGCAGTKSRVAMHPLPNALLIARRAGGARVKVRLGGDGRFKVRMRGHGPLVGELRLDGPLLTVAKYDDKQAISVPVKVPVRVRKGRARVKLDIRRVGDEHRAASAWAILSRAAQTADRAAPRGVKLGNVVAHVEPGRRVKGAEDVAGSTTAYSNDEIFVDSVARADEFEPWVLVHEYGHHVLARVASPSAPAGGRHDLELSYPSTPALAWSEGFAHAFAAIVAGKPKLGTLCRSGVDLSAHPAIPHAKDAWDDIAANEIADAGIAWRTAAMLGGGRAVDGLDELLASLHAFKRRFGHGPNDMREVRDALIEGGFERTQGDHDAFSSIWRDQGVLGYGIGVRYALEHQGGTCNSGQSYEEDGLDCEIRRSIRLSGPGGIACSAADTNSGPLHDDRQARMNGGLAHAWQDDCRISTDSAWLRFPYQPGGAHLTGDFTVTLNVSCVSHPYTGVDDPLVMGVCPQRWKLTVVSEPYLTDSLTETRLGGEPQTVSSIPVTTSVTLVTWRADGTRCTQYPGINCRNWSTFGRAP